MKTKTFNITIENTNATYFGVAVLTKDKKVYLKYFRFTTENGIEDLETCNLFKGKDHVAVDKIHKKVETYFKKKDKEIIVYSF